MIKQENARHIKYSNQAQKYSTLLASFYGSPQKRMKHGDFHQKVGTLGESRITSVMS